MNPVQVIARKRDGETLSDEEIGEFIQGYVSGDIPDYQMSAMAMAIYLRGMTAAETSVLTERMLRSGKVLEADDAALRVDKHSTGGIGDKSSLILAPLLACCGLKVPMISGRGLGATGGTLDKLESIAGFRTNLSLEEIRKVVREVGCVITGATVDLVPADRKLYALRDVTATVPSIPLITASIMSKKLAESLSSLVVDVKFGSGAFMKSRDLAKQLAESMVRVGTRMGVKTTALLTDMNQPNGVLAGNAVEVDESLELLANSGPADLREITLALATEILLMQNLASNADEARKTLDGHLASGRAMAKFEQMVAAQGGNLHVPRPRAKSSFVAAASDGYVASMDTEQIGLAIVEMGGGRIKVGQAVDYTVGLAMKVRVGDKVNKGQPLVELFAQDKDRDWASPKIANAITLSAASTAPLALIAERVT
jgi:pyrimidine-nucleoside phosphorylase